MKADDAHLRVDGSWRDGVLYKKTVINATHARTRPSNTDFDGRA
ncbi:hypothetical protein [Pelomonas sp. Root1444]|nr:hypothetical protein [Pelomonas sp. Root1444]